MNIPATVIEALLHASNTCSNTLIAKRFGSLGTKTLLHVEDDLIWMVLNPHYRYLIDNIYIYEDPFRRGHEDILELLCNSRHCSQ